MGKFASAFPAEKKVPSPQGGYSLSPFLSEGTKGAIMGNKRKWCSILLVGLVLILASSVIGCAPRYTQTDLDAAREAGYNAGFTEGYKAGLAQTEAETISPPSTETPKAGLPAGAISWDKAKDHIGDRTTVWGPVAGASYRPDIRGQPTWLNIGKDWPSPERFVVIIWGKNRGNFPKAPETYYLGKTIYVTGLITEYNAIPQIEVTDPSQIKVH